MRALLKRNAYATRGTDEMIDDEDFEKFALISQGHAAFQLLWAAVQFGIFEYLDSHPDATEAKIAAATTLDGKAMPLKTQPARILLRGLCALGLVRFSKGKYKNSPLSKKFLLRKNPNNMIDVLGWQRFIVYPGVIDFVESLKENTNTGLRHFKGTEPELYQRLARHNPGLIKTFEDAMSSLSAANNRLLASHADLSSVKHLVDLGGGDGTNALALARKNRKLKVTVFDQPEVCALANKAIAAAGLSDRVNTHPGDLFDNEFPEGIDAVMLGHMMTIWSPEKNIVLLKRVYDALPKGGRIIIFNMMSHDDGSPISCALGSVYFMAIATGRGALYTWNEQTEFMKAAGFKKVKKQVLPNAHGILVGIK